jgi:hypothetical protein
MKINLQNLASQVSGAGANSRIQLGETENAIKTTNFFGRLWNAVTRTSSEKAQNKETINQVLKSIKENGGSLSQETRDYMEGLATQGKPLSARRFNALMDEAKIEPGRAGDIESDSVDSDDDEPMPSKLDLLKTHDVHYINPEEFRGILQGIVEKSSSEEVSDLGAYELQWNGQALTGSSDEKQAKFQGKLSEYAEAPERGNAMTQYFSENTLRDLSHLMKEANITSKWEVKTSPDSNFLTVKSVPANGKNGFSFEYLPSQLPGVPGKVFNPLVRLG